MGLGKYCMHFKTFKKVHDLNTGDVKALGILKKKKSPGSCDSDIF
jgi:hypothetical protein